MKRFLLVGSILFLMVSFAEAQPFKPIGGGSASSLTFLKTDASGNIQSLDPSGNVFRTEYTNGTVASSVADGLRYYDTLGNTTCDSPAAGTFRQCPLIGTGWQFTDGSGNINPAPLAKVIESSGNITQTEKSQYIVYDASSTITLLTPQPGMQVYVMADASPGTSQATIAGTANIQISNQAGTAFCTAGQGIRSPGAAKDSIALLALGATKWVITNAVGTWTCGGY